MAKPPTTIDYIAEFIVSLNVVQLDVLHVPSAIRSL